MGYLSRDAILEATDREYEDVDVPEWGGTLRIRSITGGERDAYEQSIMQQRGKSRSMNLLNARAKLIVKCAVDEAGQRLFTEEDIRALSAKNARPLDRVFDACRRLAGLTEDDVDKLTEDFEQTQGEDSTTG